MAPPDAADRPPDDDDAEAVNWTCRLEVPERSFAALIATGPARRAGRHAAQILWAEIMAHYATEARRMRER